ncbi:MAG TPA: DUF1330 domain-containing protein [Burkholderiales bacterium]|jgi:uncharacterized protein (DUF1330 family)|nr:DUF1330 domain-containing protein [Burkholderiales bacterium]
MTAYVVLDIEVTDADKFARYRELAPPAIAAHGGRYIARGGTTELMEGSRRPNRVVILEFPTVDTAKAWLESPEYREARALRQASATTNAFVTQGL